MSPSTREYLNFFVGLAVATLIALVTLTPQLRDARADAARQHRVIEHLEQRCDWYQDGSIVCPPNTRHVSTSTTTSTVAMSGSAAASTAPRGHSSELFDGTAAPWKSSSFREHSNFVQ